jgi:hypothetical protein
VVYVVRSGKQLAAFDGMGTKPLMMLKVNYSLRVALHGAEQLEHAIFCECLAGFAAAIQAWYTQKSFHDRTHRVDSCGGKLCDM